jgi:hypothetical protein
LVYPPHYPLASVTTDGVVTAHSIRVGFGPDPSAITSGPDNHLWFVDGMGNQIGTVNP